MYMYVYPYCTDNDCGFTVCAYLEYCIALRPYASALCQFLYCFNDICVSDSRELSSSRRRA